MTSRPVRILFVEVAYDKLGADYSVHAQLIKTLAGTDRLEVMSLSHPGLADLMPEETHRVPCDTYYLGPQKVRRQLSYLTDMPLALRRALPAVREFEPDLIYSCQLRKDAMAAHVLSVATRVPHVLHLHYSFGNWLGRAAVKTTRRAEHIMAISEYVRQTALLGGIPPEQVTTVPNLTSADPVIDVSRSEARAEMGLGDDDVAIIAAGRLDEAKGFPDLIDAVASLGEVHDHLTVLVCGESLHSPGHDDELKRRVADLGLDAVFRFLGHRSDLPTLMHASDIFCLPSTMEPFGLVYIEAMRAGLPVVALLSGGVPEIVVDGVTGMLSYPGDHEALTKNLRTLIDSSSLRAELGSAGRTRLETHFDNESIAERWMRTIERIVGR